MRQSQVHYKQLIWQNGVKLGTGKTQDAATAKRATKREKERKKKQFIRADEWRRRRCRPRRQRCRDANSRGNHNYVDSNDDVSVCVHDQRNVVATLDKKPSQQMRLPNKARQQQRESETEREWVMEVRERERELRQFS